MAKTQAVPMYIRVLVARHGDQWLAQAIDFDLAAQGPSDKQAMGAFIRVFRAHYHRARHLGRDPFKGLAHPPAQLAEVWDKLVRTSSRVIPAEDGDEMPPAYIIEAIAKKGSDFNVGQ